MGQIKTQVRLDGTVRAKHCRVLVQGHARTVPDHVVTFAASEWVGKKEGHRNVIIKLDSSKKHICVSEASGRRPKLLRTIDLSLLKQNEQKSVDIILSADGQMTMMALQVPKEYDLVTLDPLASLTFICCQPQVSRLLLDMACLKLWLLSYLQIWHFELLNLQIP